MHRKLTVTRDLEMWNNFAISKKIRRSVESLFGGRTAVYRRNISRFDIFFTDLGMDFKINKHFSAGLNYRFYQNKNNDGDFMTQHRFSARYKFKQTFDRFTFVYRLQFQNKDEDFLSVSSENNVSNLRNKISVDYDIKNFKLEPYFQAELFRKYETGEISVLIKSAGLWARSIPLLRDLILNYSTVLIMS